MPSNSLAMAVVKGGTVTHDFAQCKCRPGGRIDLELALTGQQTTWLQDAFVKSKGNCTYDVSTDLRLSHCII